MVVGETFSRSTRFKHNLVKHCSLCASMQIKTLSKLLLPLLILTRNIVHADSTQKSSFNDVDLVFSDTNHGVTHHHQPPILDSQILLINHGGGARSSIRRTGLFNPNTFNPHVTSYPSALFDNKPNDHNNIINNKFNEVPYYKYDITRRSDPPPPPPPPPQRQYLVAPIRRPIVRLPVLPIPKPKPLPPPPQPILKNNYVNPRARLTITPKPVPPPPPPPPIQEPPRNIFDGIFPPTINDYHQPPNALFNPINLNSFFFNGNDVDNYAKPAPPTTASPPPPPPPPQSSFFSYFDPPFSPVTHHTPPANNQLFQRRKLALTNNVNEINGNSISGYPPYNYYRGDDTGVTSVTKWPKIFKFTDGRVDLMQFEKDKKHGKISFNTDADDYVFENVKRESFLILHGGAFRH